MWHDRNDGQRATRSAPSLGRKCACRAAGSCNRVQGLRSSGVRGQPSNLPSASVRQRSPPFTHPGDPSRRSCLRARQGGERGHGARGWAMHRARGPGPGWSGMAERTPCSRAAVVVGWDEGHLGDHRFAHLVAHLHLELCARLVEASRHVAHRHGLLEARGVGAGGDNAHLVAIHVEDVRAVARWSTLAEEAHAFALCRLVVELLQDDGVADEAAVGTTRLGDDEE
mmetsp:Transcript_5441/g.14966  ORF Transcript_5441/g.14966 Transcript_5441/m.14966 type:complete len:226 (+) Transcript_5441:216-893(+)